MIGKTTLPSKNKRSHHNIIAIVYDFDGTLSPNNMQEDTICKAYNIKSEDLWAKSDRLVKKGYERTLAYLHLLIHDEAFAAKPLSRKALHELASQVKFFPGVTAFFDKINSYVQSISEAKKWNIKLEHYIISSGMIEILEGVNIYKHFKKAYACEYEYDLKDSPIFPKLVINDTNKTQFLFRINKGKLELSEDINTHMPEQNRRVPFRNMIYIGDSITDIPSMTVIKKYGGHAIAVFNPDQPVSDRVKAMVQQGRVDHFAPADYSQNRLLMRIVETTLKKIIHTIAYYNSAKMSLEWVNKKKIAAEAIKER